MVTVDGRQVLVLGGAGFVGRHAVRALLARGADVVVGSSHPEKVDQRLAANPGDVQVRVVRMHEMVRADRWRSVVAGVNVVLNCVGILRPRGPASYDRVHHQAAAALAQACAAEGKRLVHVSALGLHSAARSGFIRSKLAGESAIRAAGGDWLIVRPSLLDGPGGFGARWLRGVARLPVYVVPADAQGQIAALKVQDLAEGLARLCLDDAAEIDLRQSREFELGGPATYRFEDYIRALRRQHTSRRSVCVPIPGWLARTAAHVCDLLHFTPFSFGHWELLRRDNVPAPNRLPDLLGRPPDRVA